MELASLESTLEGLREQAAAHGQQLDSVSHGSGGGDTSGAMARIVAVSKLADEQWTKVDALLDSATTILYGDHGRGGRWNIWTNVMCSRYGDNKTVSS